MTESHPPHPTDEALSAAIDGDDEDARVHAEGCERCRYRMDAMRGVASLLAVPPPIDEMARERAIAQAVRVQPAPAGSRRWPLAVGAAAAVLLVALLVPLVFSSDTNNRDDMAAVQETAGDEAQFGAGGSASLGAFDDPTALRNALAGVLGEDQAAASEGRTASNDASAPASTTTGPPPAAGTGGQALTKADGGPVCSGDVQRDYGERVGALLYSGDLTWSGQRSVVLVYAFKEPQGSLDKLALVLRQSDCQLLTSVSL
jgi:hypothetical protein